MWEYLRELTRLPKGVRHFLYSEPLLGISFGMFAFMLNYHFLGRGLSEVEIGELTSLHMIVMGASAIPFGLLSDRSSRKMILVAGLYLIGISFFFLGIGDTYTTLLWGQVLNALGISLMVSAEIPLLYSYCKQRKEETQTYNMMFAIFTLFTGFGTLLGGWLPKVLPQGGTLYETSIYAMGALVLIIGTIRLFLPPENRVSSSRGKGDSQKDSSSVILPSPKPTPASSRLSLVLFWRKGWERMPSRNVFIYTGFSFFAGGTFGFLVPYYNVIAKFRMNWPDEWVSLLLTVNGFMMFLVSFFTPLLLDRWGLRKASMVLLGFSALFSLALAASLPAIGFVVIFLLRNGVYLAGINLLEGQSLQATNNEERGLHAGLRSVARSVSSTGAAYAAGFMLELNNYMLPFLLTGILLLFSFFYAQKWMVGRLEKELEARHEAESPASAGS
jgi:DHA1 family multidrug resistance protein-like MFS transporter